MTFAGLILLATAFAFPFSIRASSFQDRDLTPLQAAIRQQQNRLDSGDAEERRDAIMRLGLLHHRDASMAASAGLNDASTSVKVAALTSVLSLPASESAALLIPLLKDKNEFVRQETAYALGKTGSRTAVAPLIELLSREKLSGVRGAVVVSLGQLRDEAAVVPLAQVLSEGTKLNKNVFVLRAAAQSLGEIKSRAGVPALIGVLQNEAYDTDIRREAANALGRIGDQAAISALRVVLSSGDPYLSMAAENALRELSKN